MQGWLTNDGFFKRLRKDCMKFLVLIVVLLLGMAGYARSVSVQAAPALQIARPLLLQANEGERRVRRVPTKNAGTVPSPFLTIKVDPHNGGTSNVMMLTEHLKPGGKIPPHRHLHQDEIVYIERGTVHAVVGDQARDIHDGGTIFIPHNTWVSILGIGTETISLLAFFNGSDFDAYLRCSTVPSGIRASSMTAADRRACAKAGKAQYRGLYRK